MKVDRINLYRVNNRNTSFEGITQRMPQYAMSSFDNLKAQYELCRYAKFYEALDDKIFPQNKYIRTENFSFLDKIPVYLRGKFVELFKSITSFPNLKFSSARIEKEFIQQIRIADNPQVKAVMAGYDPVCSVGLNKAFPGSDIDKAYIVLDKRYNSGVPDSELVARYKGSLWDNTDQRILSLNNENTFPEVYTTDQMFGILDLLDRLTVRFQLDKNRDYFLAKREYDINPVTAGEFNIKFAQHNDESEISKVLAKNFAYFIESVRDGKMIYSADDKLKRLIEQRIFLSPFAQMSNVTQMGAHTRLINKGIKPIKEKLRNREKLSAEFNFRDVETQFDFIKDLVKSVSKDQSGKYNKFFQNDDDIGARFDRLNVLLV